ncbi:hypothetical protein BJ508DRAFT_365923, partial [Ascobolus immersus RN42]
AKVDPPPTSAPDPVFCPIAFSSYPACPLPPQHSSTLKHHLLPKLPLSSATRPAATRHIPPICSHAASPPTGTGSEYRLPWRQSGTVPKAHSCPKRTSPTPRRLQHPLPHAPTSILHSHPIPPLKPHSPPKPRRSPSSSQNLLFPQTPPLRHSHHGHVRKRHQRGSWRSIAGDEHSRPQKLVLAELFCWTRALVVERRRKQHRDIALRR